MPTKRITRIAVFAVLITIGAKITVPFGIAPFTLQTFFVIASGFFLGGRDGAITCLIYLVIGLVGLPVFSAGGGISYIISPVFGYIIGFVGGAFISGKSLYSYKTLSFLKMLACAMIGLCTIYIVGAVYQIIILIAVNNFTLIAALSSLVSLLYLFVIDSVQMILLCLIFPRSSTLLKIGSFEFEKVCVGKMAQCDQKNCNRQLKYKE